MTLVHSRQTFLPLYSPLLDQAVKDSLDRLGVERVMGERVDMASLRDGMAKGGVIKVKTLGGREIEADYVVRRSFTVLTTSAHDETAASLHRSDA